jgi:hypothetical protein
MSRWLLLLLCACSDAPAKAAPPIIDKLEMPPAATLDAMGKATLVGMLQFHDDDDVVTTMVFRIVSTNQRTTGAISPASVGLVSVTTVLAGTKGTNVDYEVTLIDRSGLTSMPAKRSVLLQ